MTCKAQVRLKVIETTLQYQFLHAIGNLQITRVFGQKMGQNPYLSIVSAKN